MHKQKIFTIICLLAVSITLGAGILHTQQEQERVRAKAQASIEVRDETQKELVTITDSIKKNLQLIDSLRTAVNIRKRR